MFGGMAIIAQWVIPIVLISWLGIGRERSRISWALKGAAVSLYVLAAALAGMWPFDPRIALALFGIATLVAATRSFAHARSAQALPVAQRSRVRAGVLAMLVLLNGALAVHLARGRQPPRVPMIDLVFPFANGTYYAVNGGSNQLVNAHNMTLTSDRFRRWRGQSHGVDLLKLNRRGLRADGLMPSDPARYAIFGEPVLAPCSGAVISTLDGLTDLEPPRMDREHMTGNHVILSCMDAWIVLAHLREGSVCVAPGDTVAIGQRLGDVGNTGNSAEPHLHIHAQRPGTVDAPIGGEPLAIRFDGRYLARNAVIRRTVAP